MNDSANRIIKAASLAIAVSAAASLLSKSIKQATVEALDGLDPEIVRASFDASPTVLIHELMKVMGAAATAHLARIKHGDGTLDAIARATFSA